MVIARRGFVTRLAAVAGALAVAPVAVASADNCGEEMTAYAPARQNIVETAVQAGSFNTLVAAVKEAGLVDALSGDGPLTVFAPTDEAFAKLGEDMPKVYEQLVGIRATLEKHYKEMQDIEFTVQEGTLYMLQTRSGKRTGTAAVRIAVEMVKEKLIDELTAVKRVAPDSLNHLLQPQLDPKAKEKPVAQGIAASPGAASKSCRVTSYWVTTSARRRKLCTFFSGVNTTWSSCSGIADP